LNVGNALGAAAGVIAVAAGWGLLSAVWGGVVLTFAGLVVFIISLPRAQQTVAVERPMQ
jgi:DHA1 family inner membrane transport protein